jgi:N-acetylmuramoyl-L-alanine amidase
VRLHRLLPGLTLVGALLLGLPAEAASLQGWQFDTEENQLTFTTDDSVQPTAQLLANPTRLVIDLPGTTLTEPETQAYDGAIKAVRVSELDAETTRLVVEYNPGYAVDPEQVQVRGESGNQWTVQLPDATEVSAPTAVRLNREEQSNRLREARNRAQGITETTTADDTGRDTGRDTARLPLADQQPAAAGELPTLPNGQFTVVIDPGHGGGDPGAVGINGLQEKDIVNDIAPQVAAILREQGANVVMTRDRDIEVELEPRVQIAERANASVFVSIHANSINMSRPDVNGLGTYYSSESGHRLADTVQATVANAMGMQNRGVHAARFYVIRQTSMPAILIETGFVTGAQDAPNLADPEWRERMAAAIAEGILLHLQRGL